MPKEKLYRASEVIDALSKTFKNIHNKKNPKYNYNGPLLTTHEILSCDHNIDEQFTEENFLWDKEKGRDLIGLIIKSAFQLGIEQGMKMCANDISKLPVDNWDAEDWKDFKYKCVILQMVNNPNYELNKILESDEKELK